MKILKKSLLIFKINMRRCITDKRIIALILYQVMVAYTVAKPFGNFCSKVGFRTSPYIYPFFTCEFQGIIQVLTGAIILFMDAPFINNLTYNQMIRSGRKSWFIGQIFYIITASIIYIFNYILFFYLFLFNKTTFTKDWGKVIRTLSEVVRNFRIISVDKRIVNNFTTGEAMFFSISLSVIQCILIAMIIFYISLYFRDNKMGVLASIAYVFSSLYVARMGIEMDNRFVPSTWMILTSYDRTGLSSKPPLSMPYIFLLGAIAILIILSYIKIKRKEIDTYPEIN
ncbi:MAG: hypothetical protein Q4P34_05680 [Tissierellia bacterium]|nr:hypothetical protein [Tissierellia bacterium]